MPAKKRNYNAHFKLYDFKGEFVKDFIGVQEVAKYLDTSVEAVVKVLYTPNYRKYRILGHYLIRGNDHEPIIPSGYNRPYYIYNKDGRLLTIADNARAAGEFLYLSPSHTTRVFNQGKTYGGRYILSREPL